MFRTVVIKTRCKLELENNYLVKRSAFETVKINIDEIATLIIQSYSTSITIPLMNALVKAKVNVIICNEKAMPTFYLNSYQSHYESSAKVNIQKKWSNEQAQKLWNKIIYNKIRNQIIVLQKQNKAEAADQILSLLPRAVNNECSNVEGLAARIYFKELFGSEFSRRKDNPVNGTLNFVYSILLSAVARSIVAAGYITQIGIFHRGSTNSTNLACDFMEPFRPLLDDFILSNSLEYKVKVDPEDIANIKIKIYNGFYYFDDAIEKYTYQCLRFMNNEINGISYIEEYIYEKGENNNESKKKNIREEKSEDRED